MCMVIKRYLLFVFILLASLRAVAQSPAERLTALLGDEVVEQCNASLVVYDIEGDSLLFSHRAGKLMRPASVLKLFTSVTAVERLGAEYAIETPLLGRGNNLYIKGALDPLFSYDDLGTMLASVPQGMVVDTLFADCSFMDSVYWGPGWAWDDTPWKFQPYISPLMLCGGCVEVKASPGLKGLPPFVECYPPSAFYSVENEAVSRSGSEEKFTILRDWLAGTNVIRLRGNCRSPKSEKMNMYPSQDYFMAVAMERLVAMGVEVRNVAYGKAPAGCDTLHVVRRPLFAVVKEALKESDNLCAEALSYHLGSLYGSYPVSQEMGPKIVKGFMEYTLDLPEVYAIRDGSGLSPYSFVSADMVLQLLLHAHGREEVRDVLAVGLPQSGVDGTLKHRMKSGVAYKNVFAKTGAVTGVCNLAGYAKASNGHTLAFVILCEGYPRASFVRRWQDKVCEVICTY